MSQVQSWQIQCRRCGYANSGAEVRCGKCGFPLPHRPGLLVAGSGAAKKAAAGASSTKVAQPGGFLPRLIAFIIDWAILGAVYLLIYFVWQATLTPVNLSGGFEKMVADQSRQSLAFFITLALARRLYFVGSWTILGASPGMRVMNLQIVEKNGEPIGFGAALRRYLGLYGLLSFFTLLTGPIMVPLSPRKQGLHDLIARTYVIQHLDPERILANAEKAGPTAAPPTPAPQRRHRQGAGQHLGGPGCRCGRRGRRCCARGAAPCL